MSEPATGTRAEYIAAIDDTLRQISWRSNKQLLQTLSQPEISLTMPQMVALFAIRATGSCRMSELAEVTQQSAGALTGIVDRLIEEQLAIRLHDLNDRRVVQVMITSHGQERLARIEQARYQTMEHILRQLPCDQLTHLEALLRVLLYRIKELCNNQELIFDQRNHHPGGVASEALYKKT